ncbi:MAG: diguanylate cyclase [Novosphingobium sp.]|nr:diguanylate cyclase [Novosphingobium sp.]
MLAGALWLAAALPAFLAYRYMDVSFPVWLPSGIAVAALMLEPLRRWPAIVALIAGGSLLLNLMLGLPPVLLGSHFVANVLQPALTALLLRRLVRGALVDTMSLRDLIGLTGAALAGALPTVLPLIFVLGNPFPYAVEYYLMTVLGTIIVTPLALNLRHQIARRREGHMWRHIAQHTAIGAAQLGLSYAVMGFADFPLLFLSGAVIVITVARFGQIGASEGIFALGLAATLRSAGGASPLAFLDLSPGEAVVYLQCFMLAVTAVSLPLAALLNDHNRLARRLAARNQELQHDMTVFALAETLARIGRWRLDLKTGKARYSTELKRIFGYAADADVSFEQLAEATSDHGEAFRTLLKTRLKSRNPWRREVTIRRLDGQERTVETIAVNVFDADGRARENVGVVIDVTEQRQREAALCDERARAMRLAAEANVLAQTDPLTGLANRRRTLTQLEKCVDASQGENRLLSLVVFDIDHFKRINDGFGHQVGDEVLVRVAEITRQQMRDSDLLGRTGGEEFVWMLPGADAEVACAAAERLRQAIERDSAKDDLPGVTVSVGHATVRINDNADTLLGRADTALYEAKRHGRNCVTMAA